MEWEDDYCGAVPGPRNAVLKLLSHTNKRMSVDFKKKSACLLLVSVIYIKLRSFKIDFQNVDKIYSASKHLVLSTPKYKYLLKRKTVLIASFLWIIAPCLTNLEGFAVFTEMKLPALLFRRDYKHLVVTSSYLSIMIWLTLNDCWKNKRLKIKRYHSFEEVFVLFCATSPTFFLLSRVIEWMQCSKAVTWFS